MNMAHNHDNVPSLGYSHIATIYFCLFLNLAFVAVEAALGFMGNSTGLVSDAGHNLSDVLGLVLSLVALYMEKSGRPGAKRTSGIVTLVNASLLIVAVGIICVESISKIIRPEPVNGLIVIYTAAAGILINGFTAWILMKGSGNVNIKAAFLHAATDTLVSVGVVVSGFIIRWTGFHLVDPIVSLVISLIIAVPSVKLIWQTVGLIRNS